MRRSRALRHAQSLPAEFASEEGLLSAAFAKCDATFAKKWVAAEKRGGAACQTTGDAAPLQARAFDFSHFAALSLDAARFIANGDGTVTDTRTGLQWEMKEFADGEASYSDPHDVDNTYTWSATGTAPDGTAFTQFLGALNTCVSPFGNDGFAGHCDWRLPTFEELRSFVISTSTSPPDPFIDPTLRPVADPGFYWSSITTGTPSGASAEAQDYGGGSICSCTKTTPHFVRAVRDTLGPIVFP